MNGYGLPAEWALPSGGQHCSIASYTHEFCRWDFCASNFMLQCQSIIGIIWRTGWDSNPRSPCRLAAFRVRCHRPLDHLSAGGDKEAAAPRQAVLTVGFFQGLGRKQAGTAGPNRRVEQTSISMLLDPVWTQTPT